MAKSTKQKTDTETVENAFSSMQQAGFENISQLNTAVLETLGDVSAEVARFIAQRVDEDVKAQQAFLACKNVEELQHAQMEFIQHAMEQYQASTARLFDIGSHNLQKHLKENE